METKELLQRLEIMKNTVAPWRQALENPIKAQESTLERLLKQYSQTEYGKSHESERVSSYDDYKNAFPVQTYEGFKPLIDQVLSGHTNVLLSEEPIYWLMTKGTTGLSKFMPLTPTFIRFSTETMKRVFFNYSITKNDLDWMGGYRLNLNSSGSLGKINVAGKEVPYGYSVGVGIGMMEKNIPQLVTPTQEELDMIPGESNKDVWEQKYELAYQKSFNRNITHVFTAHNVLIGFAKYIFNKYQIHPKDLWNIKVLFTSGFPGANTRFASHIHSLYGKSTDIRDLYASTESLFGAQIDEKKAWVPFYDLVFLEVQTLNGVKQLHEMRPGEIGSLIVSTDYLPRYRNGDLILAFEPPYFRCIGRENTKLNPYSYGILTGKSSLNLPNPDLTVYK